MMCLPLIFPPSLESKRLLSAVELSAAPVQSTPFTALTSLTNVAVPGEIVWQVDSLLASFLEVGGVGRRIHGY